MPTVYEVLEEYKSLKSQKKRTVAEAIYFMLHGCPTCETVDNALRAGDIITVGYRKDSSWSNRTGRIESFEVLRQGTRMWFGGYYGYLYGLDIKKLCPDCLKPIHSFKF